MCCMRLAENTGRKNDAKNRHLGTIVNFVGLYFAALNRGRHLCAVGRPSRWALAHILVYQVFKFCLAKVCFVLVHSTYSSNEAIVTDHIIS